MGEITKSTRTTHRRRPLPRLTMERILDAALQIVASKGLDGLSMRVLASALNTAASSLYRHIADRNELVVAMLNHVAANISVPPIATDPQEDVLRVVLSIRESLRAQPWAVQAFVFDGLSSDEGILPLAQRMYSAMRSAGLSSDQIACADSLIWHYVYGELIHATHFKPNQHARRVALGADPIKFGEIVAAAQYLPEHPDEIFEKNLRLLLKAIFEQAN